MSFLCLSPHFDVCENPYFGVRSIFRSHLLGLSEIFLIFVQISVAVLARL